MELRRKILVGYGVVLGLVVIVCVWAVVNLYQLGRASEAILQENYRSILAAENMINAIERQDSGLLLLMQGYTSEGLTQFRENEVEFLQWLSRAKDNITLEREAETLEIIEGQYLVYLEEAARLSETIPGDSETTSNYYHETVLPKFKLVRDACTELREMNQQAMLSASERAQTVSTRAIWSMTILGVVVAVLGLILSLFLSNFLVHPLKEMTQAAGRIAEGDYDVSITVRSRDELGQLAEEIMTMSQKLKSFHELNVNRLLAEKRRGEAIIRSISDGLIMVDADLKIIALNPMAAQMLKISLEEGQGQHCFDVVPSTELYTHIKRVAETGQPPQFTQAESIFAVQHGDQTEYYQFSITPVKTEQGQMLGVVLLLQDVTKLTELDRLKSDFVMTASHELRTPLTSIAMSIGLLMEGASAKLSDQEQELLQAAEEDVQRLRHLVNNLLDLSKIEAGRVEMEFEPVDGTLLTSRAISTLTNQAEEKGIELTQDLLDELPQIKADPNKITWVLTNLIANALRYTEPGGHVCVSAEHLADFVYFSVTDDGAGIPFEYQSKIFDKFVQVRNDQAASGSGLGLAICKEIVKAHGGIIWVESVPDQGSNLTFNIPVAKKPPQKGADKHG
jgi:NtrC-family two-component system sensor histidine kinase KinB